MIGRIGELSARYACTEVGIWVLAAAGSVLWAPSLTKVGVQDEAVFSVAGLVLAG